MDNSKEGNKKENFILILNYEYFKSFLFMNLNIYTKMYINNHTKDYIWKFSFRKVYTHLYIISDKDLRDDSDKKN
jgi:hypothetical protein